MSRAAALTMLLGLSACTQPALERYCQRSQSCACTSGRCCILPGFSCEAGQPCCEGTCSNGVCPGGPADGGGSDGGDGDDAGGNGGGARCTPGCLLDGGCPDSGCLNADGGCPEGVCCQSDLQCSGGQCLVDVCSAAGFRAEGESCDDATDCSAVARCDKTRWPPRCAAPADAGPPACWPEEVLCSGAAECCSGLCGFGWCHAQCSYLTGSACSRASDCCDYDRLACDGTGHCVTTAPGFWPAAFRCEAADQCLSKRCEAGQCPVLDPLHPGAQASCRGGVPCEGGAACDGGTCCLPLGEACVEDRSCCEGQCLAQRCAPALQCAGPAEPCRDDSDCCAPSGCSQLRHCGPTLATTLRPEPCVIEDNEMCRFPFTEYYCRLPGGQSYDLACCRERGADGGLTHCQDAGTCTCAGDTCDAITQTYVCPLI